MDEVTFTITCKMKRRWAERFIGMLRHMQTLGNNGSSRNVIFYADGDGDFRPRFSVFDNGKIEPAEPKLQDDGSLFFDAG